MKKIIFNAILVFILISSCFTFSSAKNIGLKDNVEDAFLVIQDTDSTIQISNIRPGYLYLLDSEPMELPFLKNLNSKYAVVINYDLLVDTIYENIDHVNFVSKRMFAGWETNGWDYTDYDGFYYSFGSSGSGFYNVDTYGLDEYENIVCEDSIKVLFLRVKRSDFGVRVKTFFDGVETFNSLLDIGIQEFSSMVNSGESKRFKLTIQDKDDTTLDLQFNKKTIDYGGSLNVIETSFDVDTDCDTSKSYGVSLELRFPFRLLNNNDDESDTSFFKLNLGYNTESGVKPAVNSVNSCFAFGKQSIDDPGVLQMKLIPNNIENDSEINFYNSFETFDQTGKQSFYRGFNLGFTPATDLTITSVPKNAKVHYDFGRSTGKKTDVSFRALGGRFDDIVQKFSFDPLPAFMGFDLTLLGQREFLYESDSSYDVGYSIESLEDGNLVCFKVDDVPRKIHSKWGVDLGEIGDMSVNAFTELNMSEDISSLTLCKGENLDPVLNIEDVPKKIRFDADLDLLNHEGGFTVTRDIVSPRVVRSNMFLDNFVLSNVFELNNKVVSLSWDVDKENRVGDLVFTRDNTGGFSKVKTALGFNNWVLSDEVELKNNDIGISWDLPDDVDNHGVITVDSSGSELFKNTVSVVDDSVELFNLSLGVATDDDFEISWDKNNHLIENFNWGGKLLRIKDLHVMVNHPDNDFNLNADLMFGQNGFFDLQLNRETDIQFTDLLSPFFKLEGYMILNPDRHINLSWDLDESGEVTFYTFNDPVGTDFNIQFGFDPLHLGNYRYGFELTGEDFVDITRTVRWYADGGELQRIWILGDETWIPDDWDLGVLWNYDWYPVPWPL